jgi:hypothetical protein
MRGHLLVLGVLLGCGEVEGESIDAPGADAAVDTAPDTAGCQPRSLLMGGAMVEPQGWSVTSQAPSALTYGPDYVRLDTSTAAGATTGGQLLLNYPGALPAPPFKVQVVLLVERVNPHNQLDAAVAILGSFTPPFGAGNDRGQMIYLDGGSIGWADEAQAFTASITNNAYHTLELAVDAGGAARVTLDGIAALARAGYVSNGALAIGDQTNDANVDGAIRIRSVTLLCP